MQRFLRTIMAIRFTDSLPKDFQCCLCSNAIYGAKQTRCCGTHICKGCSDRITNENNVASIGNFCPSCKASPLVTHDDLYMQRKLAEQTVECLNSRVIVISSRKSPFPVPPLEESKPVEGTNHSLPTKGCEWKGELRKLAEHLQNECLYVLTTCKYKCRTAVLKWDIEWHEEHQCRERPYKCSFCDLQATAEEIDRHASECKERLVPCPNNCPKKLKEYEIAKHLELQCPLQIFSCIFSSVGCSKPLSRDECLQHMEDEGIRHLDWLVKDFTATKASFTSEIASLKRSLQDKDKQLEELRSKIAHLDSDRS